MSDLRGLERSLGRQVSVGKGLSVGVSTCPIGWDWKRSKRPISWDEKEIHVGKCKIS